MADAAQAIPGPVAQSPIAPVGPVEVVDGWRRGGRVSDAALRLTDLSYLAKVLVRAGAGGPTARALGVGYGRAARDAAGRLVVGSGPGEWMLLGPTGTAASIGADVEALPADGLVSVIDLTHARALMRLSGPTAAGVLAKVCAVDLDDRVTPDGSAFRTSVAKLVTDVVRDDAGDERSYLLHCERSSGQYLFDALLDAGAEYHIDASGVSEKEL